jgi:hypothetical protein
MGALGFTAEASFTERRSYGPARHSADLSEQGVSVKSQDGVTRRHDRWLLRPR